MQTTINNTKLKKCNTIITNKPYVTKKIFVNGVQVFGGFIYDNGYSDSDLTYSVAHQSNNNTKYPPIAEWRQYDLHLLSSGSGPGSSGNDNRDCAAWAIVDGVNFDGYDNLSIKFDMEAVWESARIILGVIDDEPGLGAGLPQAFNTYLKRSDFVIGEYNSSVTDQTLNCNVTDITGTHKIIIMVYSSMYYDSVYTDVYVYQIELS